MVDQDFRARALGLTAYGQSNGTASTSAAELAVLRDQITNLQQQVTPLQAQVDQLSGAA